MGSMAVTVCSSEPSSLSHLQKLPMSDIRLDCSFDFKYIKGKIAQIWALHSAGKIKRMKMILEEETGKDGQSPSRINVFLTGAFAEEFIGFSVGDTVIIGEAVIEKSPSFLTDSVHLCNIVVERKWSRPSVWVIPAKNPTGKAKDTRPRIRQNPAISSTMTGPASTTTPSPNPTIHRQNPTATQNGRVRTLDGARTDSGAGASSSSAVMSSVPSTSRVTAENQSPGTSPWKVTSSGHPMDPWSRPDASSSLSKRSYTYTDLKDLQASSVVNVFGVVKFFKPPYKTRGTDYCMTVTLIDPTLDPNHRGLRCQLFRDDVKALPRVHAIGDIVRFHRLKIRQYYNEIQGQKGNGFHCLVFDGWVDAPMHPRSSSPNFTLTDDDKRRVTELRLWSSRHTQLAQKHYDYTLAKMYPKQYMDLTCQVVSVVLLPNDNCTVIRVWDGTHYRGPVRMMDTSAGINPQCDLELFHKSEGLAYDVTLYDNHMETGAKLKPGQFIKICNLHVAKFKPSERPEGGGDMVELVLHYGTSHGRGVVTLMDWDQAVKDMKKRMADIIANPPSTGEVANQNQAQPSRTGMQSANGSVQGSPSRCMQRSATVITDHFHQRSTRIRDVISRDPPNKFRIRAKVIDYLPDDIASFIHLYCTKCKFRCRVPQPKKSAASEKTSAPKKAVSAANKASPAKEAVTRREYDLSNAASTEAKAKQQETDQGRITRSIASRSTQDSPRRSARIGSSTRGGKTKTDVSGGSSAEDSSPTRRGRTPRKRPASGISEEEDTTSRGPRKNRRGTSKMAPRTGEESGVSQREVCGRMADAAGSLQDAADEGNASSGASNKRYSQMDSYGRKVTAEVQSSDESGQEDGEDEESKRSRRKIKVEVEGLTVKEALLMVRLGMKLVHLPDMLTGQDYKFSQDPNHWSPDGQVYYLCPRCSPTDDTQSKSNPDAPLLQYKYCLKLVLDDGTGCIEVIVNRQYAQTFFQNIRATNPHTSVDTKFKLEEVMAKLCPYPARQRLSERTPVAELTGHPWLDCCIMSYPVSLVGSEVTRYQMFDTTLALDVE